MSSAPKALVLGGKTGLLGQALASVLQTCGWDVTVTGGASDMDFAAANAADSLSRLIDRATPQVIFNTVAYTQVDAAEENAERAVKLNATLPAILGRLCRATSCRLVHYSTDFVFDGKASHPYGVEDKTGPLCVYGKTKLAGEDALLSAGLEALTIIRTAWLFGPGRNNFISTILGLARERDSLNVVHDQIGSPTYSVDLAQLSLKLVEAEGNGLFHIVNSGSASWCDFATEAVNLAHSNCVVQAIPSSSYPQKAKRPVYSVLDTASFARVTGIIPRPWALALREYVFREFLPADDA